MSNINATKKIELRLKVTIETHAGEDEDDVYKHLCNLLYDHDSDITDIREADDPVGIIQSLLAWKPDDLPNDEIPEEWKEAEEFIRRERNA